MSTAPRQWPLLQREWRQHLSRRASGRVGAYPGLLWALVALSLPLVHQGMCSYGLDSLPDRSWTLRLSGLWLIGLGCLRACIGCAVAMAEEVEHHSIDLVRRLPRSGGCLGLLTTKALVVSAPILVEWALFFGLGGILWGLELVPSLEEVTRCLVVGLCSLVTFSSLGLWVGGRLAEPERAAHDARFIVFMILFGWSVLEYAFRGPFLWIGALLWFGMIFRSSRRVPPAQGAIMFAFLLLLALGNLELGHFSPLAAAYYPELTRPDCLLYLGGALLVGGLNLRQLSRA